MDKVYTNLAENLAGAFRQYPRPAETVSYGTAGFRAHAETLPSTVYRMGFLAALRSRFHGGKTIGVMITASHNPPADNGLKLIDPQGEMLDASWESIATQLANVDTEEEFIAQLNKIIATHEINLSTPSHVIYGYDSRASSIGLSEVLAKGLAHAHTNHVENTGLLTTPQLHYIVLCENSQNSRDSYGEPTIKGYNSKLASAYRKICADLLVYSSPVEIVVDAANGVGAPRFHDLTKLLSDLVHATIVNDKYQEPELLNHNCGADFVKVNQKLPRGIVDPKQNKLYCSFDGDADRIIFFYLDGQNQFRLLDGDKIATLAMDFLGELVSVSEVEIRVGVVQTAYANGSSTEYLTEKLKAPVLCTPTGVKHLHHAARSFDIGVYFEANGHGTVLFQPAAINSLKNAEAQTPAQQTAIDTLLAFSDLINQTVGDAISDLLMVLAILSMRKWTPDDWNSSYKDLPNRLLKVQVKDRTEFKTTDAERKLVSPPGLQANIDASVGKYNQARCFVRASGTENVVRIYVEAQTNAQVEGLGLAVVKLLEDYV